MRTLSVGVVLLLALLVSRQTVARQPCRPQIENLEVTVEEVRIDGVLAAPQPSGDYAVDGGAPVRVTTSYINLADEPDRCTTVTSRTFFMDVIDPLSGEATQVMFEATP